MVGVGCTRMSRQQNSELYTKEITYYKTLPRSITWELARNERQTNDALGTEDLSEPTARSETRIGSFIVLPFEKLTSKSGNFTATAAGIITLFAKPICTNHR